MSTYDEKWDTHEGVVSDLTELDFVDTVGGGPYKRMRVTAGVTAVQVGGDRLLGTRKVRVVRETNAVRVTFAMLGSYWFDPGCPVTYRRRKSTEG